MAFSPDTFKKAAGGPLGVPPPPAGKPAGGGLDMEALMGAPGGEDQAGDIEGPGGEMGETSLQQALESAGSQVDPDKLNQIKAILGDAGGALPDLGGEEEMGEEEGGLPPMSGAPTGAPKFNSKLGKMFGK